MSAPVRILHVTTASSPIAGAERLLTDIARRAPRDSWQLAFVTLQSAGELNRLVEGSGWPSYSLDVRSPAQLPAAWMRLRHIARTFRPDIVHTHLYHASVLAALPGASAGAPLVLTRHYADFMQDFGGPFSRALDRFSAHRSAAVAAVSEAARAYITGHEGVPPERVTVIENGVDCDALGALDRAEGRRLLETAGLAGGPLIGCAASLYAAKGLDVLLRAFQTVLRTVPDSRLALLGAGPQEAELKALAEELGVASQTVFLGYRPDAPLLMSALDLYAQPSVQEGFGLAVLEAMAMGLPVVVSRVGGMAETVEHEVSGLQVEAGRADLLAGALLRLLQTPTLAGRLGRAAAQRVSERYSINRVLADYQALYDSVLAGSRRGGRS